MSQQERMGAEFALVGFFTFVGDDPSVTLREFEEIPREKIHALEEAIRETFFKDTSVQVVLYPAVVPVDYAQEAIRDFHRILETGMAEDEGDA